MGACKLSTAAVAAAATLAMTDPMPGWAQTDGSDRPPNIVFILLDDAGRADIGAYGSQAVHTPNIDRLAREGLRFTQAYAGSPLCAPSRSTLLTGTHTGHTPVRGNFGGTPLPADAVTFAELLQPRGYTVGGFGKWGLGEIDTGGVPEQQGFDAFFGYYHQVHAHDYYPTHLYLNGERVDLPGNAGFDPEEHGGVVHEPSADGQEPTYSHYAIFEEMKAFIRENRDEPFFCYAPWTPPHNEYQIPADDPAWRLYKDQPWSTAAKVHAAMITMCDRQIGEVLDLLEELELEEETIVFFTSDNGAARRFEGELDSSGPFRGRKRSLYEGGVRTPLIVHWPGRIEAGATSDLPTYFPDMLPTFAELAGVEASRLPEAVDGVSIVPTLLGEAAAGRPQPRHRYLYWELSNTDWGRGVYAYAQTLAQAARMGDWKAYRPAPGEPIELYDLASDPGEENNVAKQHSDVVATFDAIFAEATEPPATSQDRDASPRRFDRDVSGDALHVLKLATPRDLHDLLTYRENGGPLVTAHRGGARPGFPENAIATFENTLRHTWAMMEVDPRYTKDGRIVLFHDRTLERTSTGAGRVEDHTLDELRRLKLKDSDGTVTEHTVPTLGEALEWARGRTVLILDDKGVSIEDRVRAIREHDAQAYAVVMAYNLDDATKCHALDPTIMMQVFMGTPEAVERFDATGLPWRNVIGFVTHQQPKDPDIFRLIHERRALAVMGTSRTIDRAYAAGEIDEAELVRRYRAVIESGADIVEADLAVEAGRALAAQMAAPGRKRDFFQLATP